MYFVMHAFSNHVVGLHNVTPFVPLQQTAVLSDGVVYNRLRLPIPQTGAAIPLLWRGVKPVHFVMSAFSNHAVVLHNVTPFVPLQQTAVLSDGVVYNRLRPPIPQTGAAIPLLWRGGGHKHFVMHAFSNHAVVLHNVTPIDFDICNVSTTTIFRFCTKLRHLTYWLKWRVHSAIIGGSI